MSSSRFDAAIPAPGTRIAARWTDARRTRLTEDPLSALGPEVALFHDKPVGAEAQQGHPRQILGAAIDQPGLRGPGHCSLIAINDRLAEPAPGRLLLREHAGQVIRLRLAERMLLPECALGIQRSNRSRVVLAPAALPHIRPPLSGLPRLHPTTI